MTTALIIAAVAGGVAMFTVYLLAERGRWQNFEDELRMRNGESIVRGNDLIRKDLPCWCGHGRESHSFGHVDMCHGCRGDGFMHTFERKRLPEARVIK